MTKFAQPVSAIKINRRVEAKPLPGGTLVLVNTAGLYTLRFGEYVFDITTTDGAYARRLFAEEHFALSSGMRVDEEGSGWHAGR